MARDAGRVAGVKGIHTPWHRPVNRLAVSYAEEVVGLVLGKPGHHKRQEVYQLILVLAQTAAHGVPIKRQRAQVIDRVLPQRLVHPSVHNAVHSLLAQVLEMLLEGARLPPMREEDRLSQPLWRDVIRLGPSRHVNSSLTCDASSRLNRCLTTSRSLASPSPHPPSSPSGAYMRAQRRGVEAHAAEVHAAGTRASTSNIGRAGGGLPGVGPAGSGTYTRTRVCVCGKKSARTRAVKWPKLV